MIDEEDLQGEGRLNFICYDPVIEGKVFQMFMRHQRR